MAYSYQRVVSDGSLSFIDVAIDYLDRSEISVYFDDFLTDAWIWSGTSDKRILFADPVPAGVTVMVKRITDASKLRHEFSRGAKFTSTTLDEDLRQALHMAQEAGEANQNGDFFTEVNLHGYRLRNVGTAVDDSDALTLGQARADGVGATAAREAAEAAAEAAELAAAAAAGATEGLRDEFIDSGASLVEYPGSLGYVANTLGWAVRTAQGAVNVLRYITPAKWGAVLGNVVGTDVTAEIVAAVAAESNLYWPNGRYETSAPLVPGRGHTSVFASRNGAAVVQNDPTKAIWFVQNPQPSNANVDFTLVSGIHVGGVAGVLVGTNGGLTPGVSVHILGAWLYNNVVGLHIRNGWNIELRGSRVSSSGSACVQFDTPTGGAFINTVLIEQCELNLGAAQYGVMLPDGNCNGITIRSTIIENSTHASGVGIASPNSGSVCIGLTVDDVYMERLPLGFIRVGSNSSNSNNSITRCRLYAPNTANYVGIGALRGFDLRGNLFDFAGATPTPVASMMDCTQDANSVYYSGAKVTVSLVPGAGDMTNCVGRHNAGFAIPVDTAQGNTLRTNFMFASMQPPAISAIPGGTAHDFTHITHIRRYGKSSGTQKFGVQSTPLLLTIGTSNNGSSYFLTCAPYGTTITKTATGTIDIKLPAGVVDVHSEVQRHRKASFCPNITSPVVKQAMVGATAPASNDIRVLVYNAAGSALTDLATGDIVEVELSLFQSD